MAVPTVEGSEFRVLVLAPTGRDAALARRVLEESGIRAETCADLEDLRREIQHGAGAVLLTEEALGPRSAQELASVFSNQLPWSDLSLLVFSSRESKSEGIVFPWRQLGALANVVLLDRPTRKATLVSAVRAALRARRRQYEVRDLLSQLERGVRDRDRFLAMLGHELRNPLGAILTSVQLMEQREPKALARERAVIHRQTRLVSRLVDDLLDVSRVTSGKIALERRPLDLGELVGRCVESHAATAASHRIDLTFSAKNSVVVEGDPLRLEQIVNNLLTNALKYTPAGGHVGVTLTHDEGHGEVRIQDSGVGIEADALPRVFDLFMQADNTLDRSQGGLGIGLTLVRSLVESHGGTVRAESPGRGEGSTFVVRLPAAAGSIPADSSASGQPTPGRRWRILLVEDNADVREGLKSLLEEVGHEVRAAPDGIQGIEIALAWRPEIALVDIGIPRLDGYAVARQVREALGERVLLVALTGYGLPEDRRRALEAGFDAHLTKPIRLNAIMELVESSGAGETGSPLPAARRAGTALESRRKDARR